MSKPETKKALQLEALIREGTPEDAAAICELLRESFAEFVNDYTPEAFDIVTPPADEIAGRFEEGPIWVAAVGNEIVGTVSVLPEPDWLYIRSMAVSPRAQGMGIAANLLEKVERYGIESGYQTLFLYTTPFSKAAISLYKKFGFVHVRDTTADEWYGTPGVAMEKAIDANKK